MERAQAEREQTEMAQRQSEGDSWIQADSRDGSFDRDTFFNLGNYLSSQVATLTTEASSQTPTATVPRAETPPPVPPSAPPAAGGTARARLIIFGLLAAVVMLIGTNAYSYSESRVWKAESLSLRERVAELENNGTMSAGEPRGLAPTCPGSQLIDTCWLKMGWGDCTESVIEDPIKPLEDALSVAWDSTTEIFGAVTEIIKSDMQQVCDALHALGSFIFEL